MYTLLHNKLKNRFREIFIDLSFHRPVSYINALIKCTSEVHEPKFHKSPKF